jgi:hypothetical protein
MRNGRQEIVVVNQLTRALYSPVLADPRRPAHTTRFAYLHPERPRSSSSTTTGSPTTPPPCSASRRARTQ